MGRETALNSSSLRVEATWGNDVTIEGVGKCNGYRSPCYFLGVARETVESATYCINITSLPIYGLNRTWLFHCSDEVIPYSGRCRSLFLALLATHCKQAFKPHCSYSFSLWRYKQMHPSVHTGYTSTKSNPPKKQARLIALLPHRTPWRLLPHPNEFLRDGGEWQLPDQPHRDRGVRPGFPQGTLHRKHQMLWNKWDDTRMQAFYQRPEWVESPGGVGDRAREQWDCPEFSGDDLYV